jgi:hypothetical protein
MQQGVAKTPIPRQRFAPVEAKDLSILPMIWDMARSKCVAGWRERPFLPVGMGQEETT